MGRPNPKFIAGLQINYNGIISTGISLSNENTILWQFKIMLTKNLQLYYAHDISFSKILFLFLNSSELRITYSSIIKSENNYKILNPFLEILTI